MKKQNLCFVWSVLLLLASIAVAAPSLWAASVTVLRHMSIQFGTSNFLSGAVGNSGNIQQAGTVSGGGSILCTDSNLNDTTSGCGVTKISIGILNSGICSTGASSPHTCTNVVTFSPTQPDTGYSADCSGSGASGSPFVAAVDNTSTSTVTVTISNGTADQGVVSTYSKISCNILHN